LIGLIPEQNIFDQIERYKPLAAYLSKKIGIEIKLKILTRYGNIIDNFTALNMDGAFMGSFTYALAHKKIGLQVIARPESMQGVSTYHGYIFVRKDSGIHNAGDMKGKRFVFVDKATTAGFLLPMAFFHENGIRDYKSYLKETYFAGTHEDAIYDVLNKKADVGAAKNTVFERLARNDNTIKKTLAIITKSPDVPENGLAVRKDLDESIKMKLKESLLTMHEDPEGMRILTEFGARKFIVTTDHDYEAVFDYAEAIHLDLSTYDYLND
jgi:phosphonate transport system substrate-binding protein